MVCMFDFNRYTINDRNLGRLLSRITTTYNTELQLWKVCTGVFVIMTVKLLEHLWVEKHYINTVHLLFTCVDTCVQALHNTLQFSIIIFQMEHFFSLTPDAGAGEIPRKQALETVKNNIEWVQRNEDEIRKWLEANTDENN